MYLTSISYVQCFRVSLHNDDNECNVQTNKYDLQALMYPIICMHHKLRSSNRNRNPAFPWYMKQLREYDGTTMLVIYCHESVMNEMITICQAFQPESWYQRFSWTSTFIYVYNTLMLYNKFNTCILTHQVTYAKQDMWKKVNFVRVVLDMVIITRSPLLGRSIHTLSAKAILDYYFLNSKSCQVSAFGVAVPYTISC